MPVVSGGGRKSLSTFEMHGSDVRHRTCVLTYQHILMYCWIMTTTTDLSRLTRQFQALSDETRLRIIDMLRRGERCVCDLTEALDSGQSRLSFHLKVLKDAGLVTDRREGRWSYYELNPDAFAQLQEFVGELPSTKLSVLASRCCG
jgi:ArsR family transcriptional regulator, arsenate/arsenite/antimonite-responsive transcriptional repressor